MNIDQDVHDILSQLQTHNQQPKQKDTENETITRDNLESFLIKSAGGLVQKALGAVEDAHVATSGTVESEEIEAVAELTKAAAAAIEALNKIYVTLEKSRAAKELKTMDITARLQMNNADNETKLLLSREEVFQELFDKKGAIDIESTVE